MAKWIDDTIGSNGLGWPVALQAMQRNPPKWVDIYFESQVLYIKHGVLRYSYNGNTSVFQTEARGSIPLYRFSFYYISKHNRLLLKVFWRL